MGCNEELKEGHKDVYYSLCRLLEGRLL